MATITNGTVEYSHVVKLEDFGVNKKAGTSLSFTLDEGEDAAVALATVNKLVMANVATILGKAKAAAAPAQTPAPPKTVETTAKSDKEKLAEAAGVSEADLAKVKAAEEAGLTRRPAGPRKPAETKPKPTADASSVVEEDGADEFAATPSAPPVKDIPDADLNSAMTKKNAEIKSSKAIRELVGSFAPDGHAGVFHAHDIPQARRQEFLNALKALKPAA